jgi:hypothetical protein
VVTFSSPTVIPPKMETARAHREVRTKFFIGLAFLRWT